MDWNDFAQRLTVELTRLPVDAFMIVQGVDGFPYVQAMRYRHGLHAEAVSNAYLPQKLDAGQDRRMVGMGWEPPDGEERLNYWSRVPLPADGSAPTADQESDAADLAARMAIAFQEVYGVRAPAELAYQALRNGVGAGPLPMPELGLRSVGEAPGLPDGPGPDQTAGSWGDGRPADPAAPDQDEPGGSPQPLEPTQVLPPVAAPTGPTGRAERSRPPAADPAAAEPALSLGTLEHPDGARAEHAEPASPTAEPPAWGDGEPAEPAAERSEPPRPEPLAAAQAEHATVDDRPGEPAAGANGEADAAAAYDRAEPVAAASGEDGLEARLAGLKERGDQQGYFKLIMESELYVPLVDGVRPALGTYNDGTYVLAFTSPAAMEQARGGPVDEYRTATFAELARGWPRPDWQLAINTRLPSAAFIDSGTLRRVAERRRPRPARQPGRPRREAPPSMVMQKVLRHNQVSHYLDGGYDWVAGRVHRAADVRDLVTPVQLVEVLGLDHAGSPFTPGDAYIHVIRWQQVKGAPVQLGAHGNPPEFRVDSQRLPHGAELLRFDITGGETLVASYDADVRRWIKR